MNSKIDNSLIRRVQKGFLALIGVLLSVSLFACVSPLSGATKGGRVHIRFSTWGSAEELTVLRGLLKTFEASHPRIVVDLVHIPENYFQKLHILVAGGLTPDVMAMNSLSFPMYAEDKVIAPLESKFQKPTQPGLHAFDFFTASRQAMTRQGHLYAVPRDVSDLVVFINQDCFNSARLPYPQSGWTLADFHQTAHALTKIDPKTGSITQFGTSFFGKPPLTWLPFVWSEGGDLFDAALTHVTLNSPQAIQAIQFDSDLRNRWHVAPQRLDVGNATMSQLFLQGHLAMLISGRWTVPVLRQQATFHWDVVPFPSGSAGSRVGIDASGYAMSQTTAYPTESWQLIAFLSSKMAQTQFAQSGLIVPARQDVAKSSAFLAGKPAHGAVFLEAVKTGVPSRVPVRWDEQVETLNLALEPVWEGTTSAKSAIQNVTPQLEALLHD